MKYSASLIEQMVGRANRTQGTQHGKVFVINKMTMNTRASLELIRSQDKLLRNTFAPGIVLALVKVWENLNLQQKKQVEEQYGGYKWIYEYGYFSDSLIKDVKTMLM